MSSVQLKFFVVCFCCVLFFPLSLSARLLQERGRVGPAEVVVYEVQPVEGRIHRLSGYPREGQWRLTESAKAAVFLAPEWIRVSLTDKLGMLEDYLQESLAEVIQKAYEENPRFVDEIAFTVANLPYEDYVFLDDKTGVTFDPFILLENVRLLHEVDALLDYVELVDVGDPEFDDHFYTTVRYRLEKDGEAVFYELPQERYYWWIVHPKISMEPVVYIDPPSDETRAKIDGGRFWREYLLAQRGAPQDPTRPFVLRVPYAIDNAQLQSWGPTARGYLASEEIDPIAEVVRASDGMPVMLRVSYRPSGMSGGYNGTIWATTMGVELSYIEGDKKMLLNLVSMGDGNVAIRNAGEIEPILVLKDRDPFGQAAVEEALLERGYPYDVMDSTAFMAISDYEEFESMGYQKVIVPSDQPRAFYEVLSQNREVIDRWVGQSSVDDDNVFAFHGMVSATNFFHDDWSDLPMPGAIRGFDLDIETESVEVRGYPLLMDVMLGADVTWDSEVHPSLSGNRFFHPSMIALDRLGYVVSQNLDNNVAELSRNWAGPDGDCMGAQQFCIIRSMNPVRVLYGHYENCGGIAILMAAMGRTCLLPVMKVSGGPEDHEWNEFYLKDSPHALQVDWSDGPTRVAVPGNSQDRDYSGSKDLSMVFAFRGDGLAMNTMERYSENVWFSVDVEDASGQPVDGASVILATETYYDDSSLMLATVEVTGIDGHVEFPVGDLQNYYIRVDSPAGHWPDPDHVSWVACAHEDATNPGDQICPEEASWATGLPMPKTDIPGETIHLDLKLDGPGINELDPILMQIEDTPEQEDLIDFVVELDVTHIVRYLPSLATASETEQEGELDVFLLDLPNMLRYYDGEDFEAYSKARAVGRNSGEGGPLMEVLLPAVSTNWYLVLSNSRYVSTAQHYNANLELGELGSDAGLDATPDLQGGAGCGCFFGGDGSGPDGPLWLFVLGALVFIFRKNHQRNDY